MYYKVPVFNKKFFCIVNQDSFNLAALISSYTYTKDHYTPFFELPTATINKPKENIEVFSEDYLSVSLLQEINIKLHNALRMIGTCEYLILGGVNDKQKSYLDFLDEYNIIEIQNEEEVHFYLASVSNKVDALKCNKKNMLYGLYEAAKQNKYIKIDNDVEDCFLTNDDLDGLIVIEEIKSVSTVTAINYALSINASIAIIPHPKIDASQIQSYIEIWKNGNEHGLTNLKAEIYPFIDEIDFSKFEFATFFTIGIPYSLILENIIPISHVHLYLYPDFFVFNGIYYETNFIIGSGIVFSPLEFEDEETEFVRSVLNKNNYNVRGLIGSTATAHNLDFNLKEFPFSILHICSHGGEIDGFEINHTFKDREGVTHTVKYDEVVTFAPNPGKELIPVTIKTIFRKFDELDWRDEKKKEYPDYVFQDMFKAISDIKKAERKPKKSIPESCSIKCSDFNYQAMFNILAGVFSPIIFNNTCWSWYEIAQAFLKSGARGYIGTLWNINNNTAKECAERFYAHLFSNTVLNALHQSLNIDKIAKDKDIYLFWGLHFTSLSKGVSILESRTHIAYELLESLERWKKKVPKTEEPYKKDIRNLIEWNASQLAHDFYEEAASLIIKIKL